MNTITLWLFSVSKVQDPSLLESRYFIELRDELEKKYNILLKIPNGLFGKIEWVSPQKRADQIHALYEDPEVDILWALTGGSASNEILEYLDFDRIWKTKKPMIGYSDVTILLNAIFHKTGIVNFLWPNAKTLSKWIKWTQESTALLVQAIRQNSFSLKSFSYYFDLSIKETIKNEIRILQAGNAECVGIWGNLSSVCLLVDTPFFPSLKDKILLLEECSEFSIGIIRRNLFRLRHAHWFRELRWVIFGHINKTCYKDYIYTLHQTLLDVFQDLDIPIITNVWLGHISPMQTLPIGWKYRINTHDFHYTVSSL